MDWRASLGVAVGIGNVGATVPYIAATARGSIRPSPLAWAGGALTSLIVFTAQMTTEPSWSAVLPGTAVVYCTVIVVVAVRRVRPVWTTLDTTCAALGAAAIIGWQITGVAEVALVLSIAADLTLFTPMLVKTARDPSSEIPSPFLLKASLAVVAALAVRRFDAPSLSWPVYLAAINVTIGLLALPSRRRLTRVLPDAG
ncbi:MAG: hypothetical protein ACHQNA_02915 [Acidimicrobiales bacterium]